MDEIIVKSFFETNQFFLVYQKKVALSDSERILGLEAYLRLKTRGLESYSPAIFLPVVRRMGLLPNLTQLLVQKVVEDWNILRATGVEADVAINIDLEIFRDMSCLEAIAEILENSAMPPEKLHIDIVFGDDYEKDDALLRGIRFLKAQGVSFAAELHGEETLSREHLLEFEVGEIKIPRSLFADPDQEKALADLVTHYRKLGKAMSLKLTAVGIEKESEVETLEGLGVNYGQGYLYGVPSAITDLDQSCVVEEADYSDKIKVLIVERVFHYGERLSGLLPAIYDLILVDDNEDAMEYISSEMPAVIIIEVSSTDESGFELAEQFGQHYTDRDFSTIFVCEEHSPEQYLRAYEVNGFAYLCASAPIIETISTINRAINIQKSNRKISELARSSNELAIQSMRDAANYGDIVRLMKAVCLAIDEEDISGSLFSFMRQRNLLGSVIFRNGDAISSFDLSHARCTPTELSVFEILRDKGRLYEFGNRVIVNGEFTSFLIKNLPVDEIDRGQIRDYVAAIIECMDTRYKSILQDRAIESSTAELMEISMAAMASVENAANRKKEIIDYLNAEIGLSFHVLDLTIEQEEYLKNLVNKLISEQDWEDDVSSQLAERLQHTIECLSSMVATKVKAASVDVAAGVDEDVELF